MYRELECFWQTLRHDLVDQRPGSEQFHSIIVYFCLIKIPVETYDYNIAFYFLFDRRVLKERGLMNVG